MKTSTSFRLLALTCLLAAVGCGGSNARTASDPSAEEIAAHEQGDPTLPNKVVDLHEATAFANANSGMAQAASLNEATASK